VEPVTRTKDKTNEYKIFVCKPQGKILYYLGDIGVGERII
jgi:hypothetical protein